MTRLVIHIARPVLLWSLHFITLYALISAACAPRNLMQTDTMRVVAFIVTAASVLAVGVWLVQDRRVARLMDQTAPERALAGAAVWSAAISLPALLANLWPVAYLTSCTG